MLSPAAPAWPPNRTSGPEWTGHHTHTHSSHPPSQQLSNMSSPVKHTGAGAASSSNSRPGLSQYPSQLPPHIRHGFTPAAHLIPQPAPPTPSTATEPTASTALPHQDPAYQLPLMCRRVPKTPLYIPAALRPPERPPRQSPSAPATLAPAISPVRAPPVFNPDHARSSSESAAPHLGLDTFKSRRSTSSFDFGTSTPVSIFLSLIPGFNSASAGPAVSTSSSPGAPASLSASPNCQSRPPSLFGGTSRSSRRASAAAAALIPEALVAAIAARLQPDMPPPDQAWPPVLGSPGRSHWKFDTVALVCDEPRCGLNFGLFNRRHHCRRCGLVFCSSHSRYAVQLDQDSRFHPLGGWYRACNSCWRDFGVWDRLETERTSGSTTPFSPSLPNPEPRVADADSAAVVAAASLRKHVISGSLDVPSTSTSACSSNSASDLGSNVPSAQESSATSVDSTGTSHSIHAASARSKHLALINGPESVSSASSATIQIHHEATPPKDDVSDDTDSSAAVAVPTSGINNSNNVFTAEGTRTGRGRQSVFNPQGVSVPDQWNWSTF